MLGLPENSPRETVAVEIGSAAFVVPAAAAALVVAVAVAAAADGYVVVVVAVVVAVVVVVDGNTSNPLAEVMTTAIASSFCPVAVEKRPEIAASQTPASNLRLVAAMLTSTTQR